MPHGYEEVELDIVVEGQTTSHWVENIQVKWDDSLHCYTVCSNLQSFPSDSAKPPSPLTATEVSDALFVVGEGSEGTSLLFYCISR